MEINLHKLNKKLGLEHCVVRREPGFVPSGYFVHDVMVEKHVNVIAIIIIIKIVIFTICAQARFASEGCGHKCTNCEFIISIAILSTTQMEEESVKGGWEEESNLKF